MRERSGSPFGAPAAVEAVPEAPSVPTFGEVVERYRASFMLRDLKVTPPRGYNSILDTVLLLRLKHLPARGGEVSAVTLTGGCPPAFPRRGCRLDGAEAHPWARSASVGGDL